MNEPSVLDYLKSILNPWEKNKILIPEVDLDEPEIRETQDLFEQEPSVPARFFQDESDHREEEKLGKVRQGFPWKTVLLSAAVLLAIISQLLLEPPERHLYPALAGYLVAAAILIVIIIQSPDLTPFPHRQFSAVRIKGTPLILSLVLALFSFLAFGSHQFSALNLFLWLSSVALGIYALWQPRTGLKVALSSFGQFLRSPKWKAVFTPWTLLVILSVLLVLFFRFYRLGEVPGEMFSDHAEKLLDVADVLDGKHWIFFPRNTGREAFQMYLTAAVSQVFNTGLSFMSLKIGTALAGFFTLPFIYLLGKEVGNRWTGLIAFLFVGVAYWPNIISRIGLRFPLYPLFAAPVLYFLIRGLRRSSWNSFLLAGIALGIGLHGYSPIRFLPFVVTAAVALYLLHPQSRGNKKQAVFAYIALAFMALLVFLPLLRYWADDPMMFSYRTMTRMGTVERGFDQPAAMIFLNNLWKAITMFFWDNGGIWVHSVTGRPALSVVSAALFLLSFVYLVIRYLRKPNWQDIFLILSVPLLMMPSILSLAFPDENPSLNRTGGAIVPVFVMLAIFLESLLTRIARHKHWVGKVAAFSFVLILLLLSMRQDYDLVFQQFDKQFMANAWNTSEIGSVIRGYVNTGMGEEDSVFVVPFPHWVDTRLVGINAGYPEKDFALWPDEFSNTLAQTGSRLFILKLEDQQSILDLRNLYPDSTAWLYDSKIPGKEFWVFLVPSENNAEAIVQPETSGN